MHSPNRIGFCLTYGPPEYMIAGTTPPDRSSAAAERWALVSEALTRIQVHVSQLLRMPATQSGDQSVQIIEAAELMSGQAKTGPLTGPFTVYHRAEELVGPDGKPIPTIDREPDVIYEFVAIKAIKITLDDETIIVGKEALFVRGRYLEIGDDESRIEPVTDGVSIHYTGQVDVGRVLARHLPSIATADPQTPTTDTTRCLQQKRTRRPVSGSARHRVI